MSNRLIQAALAATLLCGAVAYAAKSGAISGDRALVSQSQARPHIDHRIKVRGKVRGLYPGAVRRMRVRVRNRFDHRVTLTSVRVRVRRASPACGRRNLRVRRYRGRAPIRAHRRVRVPVRVRMRASAAEACEGARFPLRFRARVKRR